MSTWKLASIALGIAMAGIYVGLSRADDPPPPRANGPAAEERRPGGEGEPSRARDRRPDREGERAPEFDRPARPDDANRDPRQPGLDFSPWWSGQRGNRNNNVMNNGPGGRQMPGMGGRPNEGGQFMPPGPPQGYGGMLRPRNEMPNDPEMQVLFQKDNELQNETRKLSNKYRNAAPAEHEKLKTEVQEIVTKHFEVRQQIRALELKRLEEELTKARQMMENRNKLKQQMIERHVNKILGIDTGEDF